MVPTCTVIKASCTRHTTANCPKPRRRAPPMLALPVRFARHHALRHLLVWVLVASLPINGVSNLLTQMLGVAHRHVASAPMPDGGPVVDASRLLDDPAHTHGDAAHPHLHAHAHMMFERHFHQPADDSVIALGAKESGQDGPGHASSLSDTAGLHGLRQALQTPAWMPMVLRTGWPRYAPLAWLSHIVTPLERPPQH